jgi:hypothetical protein
MSRSIESQRRKALWQFVGANVIQDFFVLLGNVCVAVSGFCQASMQTWAFVKFDAARKYKDVSGGDLGDAIGCTGHFTGECVHATEEER